MGGKRKPHRFFSTLSYIPVLPPTADFTAGRDNPPEERTVFLLLSFFYFILSTLLYGSLLPPNPTEKANKSFRRSPRRGCAQPFIYWPFPCLPMPWSGYQATNSLFWSEPAPPLSSRSPFSLAVGSRGEYHFVKRCCTRQPQLLPPPSYVAPKMCAPVKICHITLSTHFSSGEAVDKQASRILYFAMNNKLYWAQAEPVIYCDVATGVVVMTLVRLGSQTVLKTKEKVTES